MAVICDISVSLDGFVAGSNQTLEQPLGEGGEGLHEWVVRLKSRRERHGMEGGETGPDAEVVEEGVERPARRSWAAGCSAAGRTLGGRPESERLVGDEPPFRHPVFVLTHHPREPLELQGTTFTFVTDGVEAALEQARAAAGDKDVQVAGGANVVQQYLGRASTRSSSTSFRFS